jgi:hypothetical protein
LRSGDGVWDVLAVAATVLRPEHQSALRVLLLQLNVIALITDFHAPVTTEEAKLLFADN